MDEQERIGLHNLAPTPGSTKERKRVGRGQGSGTGKTSGRGQKGQKSRSGSHMMRAGFVGGQMPLHMQVPKLRGAHSKDSMPIGPFRTLHARRERLRASPRASRPGAEVTPEALLAARVLRTLKHPVKILGDGEIEVALTVHAHRFSASRAPEDRGGRRHASSSSIRRSSPKCPCATRSSARPPRRAPRRRPRRPRRSRPPTTTTDEARPRGRAEEPVAESDEPAADETAADEGDEA